jgi:hypothetical protein
MKNEGKHTEQLVIKSAGPMPTFDPQQEKKIYQRERKKYSYWIGEHQ